MIGDVVDYYYHKDMDTWGTPTFDKIKYKDVWDCPDDPESDRTHEDEYEEHEVYHIDDV